MSFWKFAGKKDREDVSEVTVSAFFESSALPGLHRIGVFLCPPMLRSIFRCEDRSQLRLGLRDGGSIARVGGICAWSELAAMLRLASLCDVGERCAVGDESGKRIEVALLVGR